MINHPIPKLRRLFLWLNRGCNARCVMCDIWREPLDSWLTVEQVRKWAPEWRELEIRSVIVCGEPLIHPRIWEIVAELRNVGLKVELLTNGILLLRHVEKILEWCDQLRVSLDGPREIHNLTRGRDLAFDRLQRGLAALFMRDPDFDAQARCAVHRLNYRALPETVQTARILGLKAISFSATDVENEQAFQRMGRLSDHKHLAIPEQELDDLAAVLDRFFHECADDFATGFVQGTPEQIRAEIWQHYAGLVGHMPRPIPRCDAPWTSAIIEPDGTVRPCFPMPAYGKIKKNQSLADMINGEVAMHFRDNLDVASDPRCLGCVCQSLPDRP